MAGLEKKQEQLIESLKLKGFKMGYDIDIIKRRREHIKTVLDRERFWITTGSVYQKWQDTVSVADGIIEPNKYQNRRDAYLFNGGYYNSFCMDNEPTPELFNAIKDALVEELKRLELIINEHAKQQEFADKVESARQYVSVFRYNTPVKSLWITDKFWIGLFIVIVIVSILNFINS